MIAPFVMLLFSNPDEFSCMSKVRVPTGRLVLELPAGMLDADKGDFVGTAVREVYFYFDIKQFFLVKKAIGNFVNQENRSKTPIKVHNYVEAFKSRGNIKDKSGVVYQN
jgi:hypothetical protein